MAQAVNVEKYINDAAGKKNKEDDIKQHAQAVSQKVGNTLIDKVCILSIHTPSLLVDLT